MERVLARSLPPELVARYVEKLAEKTPPNFVANIIREALAQGLSTELDLRIGPLRVRGTVVLRSPPKP